jgi:hypothetical protein
MYSTYRTWLLITRTLGWPHRAPRYRELATGRRSRRGLPLRTWWGRRRRRRGAAVEEGARAARDCFTKSRSGMNPFLFSHYYAATV